MREPEHLRWRVDSATYNIDLLPKQMVLDSLEKYRQELEKSIQGYRYLEKSLNDTGCPSHRMAVARRPICMLEGELCWVDEFVKELDEHS